MRSTVLFTDAMAGGSDRLIPCVLGCMANQLQLATLTFVDVKRNKTNFTISN
jgi:hypothetical protein